MDKEEGLAHLRDAMGPPRFTLNSASVDQPIRDMVRAVKAHGLHGVELWARDIVPPLSAPQLGALMRENGLGISAFQVLRNFEGDRSTPLGARLAEAERLMRIMKDIGADTLLVCANTNEQSSGDARDQVNDLRALAELAGARGLRIALEPLAWSRWLNRYESVWLCVEAVNHPALGIAIDSFHWFWGGTPLSFVDRIDMRRCFVVQLSDARPDGQRSPMDVARHHRLFPGEGVWPVGELARRLRAAGFDGYYNLEVFNDSYRTLSIDDFVTRAVRSIQHIFEEPA